ncbi:6S ribosome subunit biogenesis protein NIP7 [Nematocida displodere]|uniref:60S ribosome subunit biogenesis protein NIP7 n=1 Tax=Nematocida displodere TaxID=1805483 RepID=A0A177EIC7_9MICR|nr:6S ribosome subunit biogenesis protein NIP7 [Nematocida displodere]
MRELKPEEMEKVEKKMKQFIGSNFSSFLNPLHKIILHKQRVFYVSVDLLKKASVVPQESVACIGTCLGRFTKSNQFRIKITALPVLAMYATHRVKVKPTAEMNVLYGNHVQRAHVTVIASDIQKNSGVLLTSTSGVPLGFGVASKAGTEVVSGDRTAIIIVRHGDTGEYLREEAALM